MQSSISLPSLPRQLEPGVVAPDKVLSMGQNKINCVLIINWVIWNITVFDIEIVYLCETELFKMELFFYIETVYFCETEFFEIELFFDIEPVYLC